MASIARIPYTKLDRDWLTSLNLHDGAGTHVGDDDITLRQHPLLEPFRALHILRHYNSTHLFLTVNQQS